MKVLTILTRRLKEGKTYDDFRKAWYHTVGFGLPTRLYSAINAFDTREIIVVAMGEVDADQAVKMLRTDVRERLEHPLDGVIEPEIGRTFGIIVAEDDFSPQGSLEFKLASVGGRETDFAEVAQGLALAKRLIAQAAAERDEAKKSIKKD
ncbi:MAG TPA: hypothetical protein VEC08_03250 [Nitrososphaerales archaeon]|nr:hypothetical protein [Nitrososphaerales archaeon]